MLALATKVPRVVVEQGHAALLIARIPDVTWQTSDVDRAESALSNLRVPVVIDASRGAFGGACPQATTAWIRKTAANCRDSSSALTSSHRRGSPVSTSFSRPAPVR